MMIRNFSDFCSALLDSGFSMGGGNPHGIYAVVPFDWESQPAANPPIRWHTGDPETDPWEWRMRVLEERNDIAYAKLFFRSSGYITKKWAPYFLSVRRGHETFDEAYYNGQTSQISKRIYELVQEHEVLPLHEIKQRGGFTREDNSRFDRALVELQTHMFITMCGRSQKQNRYGEGYGWNSTVFCTTEHFWGGGVFSQADRLPKEHAFQAIRGQVLKLNPCADEKRILKFIVG